MRSRASQSWSDKHEGCLSVATNLSGTNLDAEGARRVSGMDATNQFTFMPDQIEKCREPAGQAWAALFFGSFLLVQQKK